MTTFETTEQIDTLDVRETTVFIPDVLDALRTAIASGGEFSVPYGRTDPSKLAGALFDMLGSGLNDMDILVTGTEVRFAPRQPR